MTGLSGKLRQRKSRIFLRLSFLAMRKVCVYSVCMADAQNPLTVPAILVSGQARCRCRRQNTGRTDRTLCRGVCGRFSGRYYEPVRKSLSNMERQLIHSPFDTKMKQRLKRYLKNAIIWGHRSPGYGLFQQLPYGYHADHSEWPALPASVQGVRQSLP